MEDFQAGKEVFFIQTSLLLLLLAIICVLPIFLDSVR